MIPAEMKTLPENTQVIVRMDDGSDIRAVTRSIPWQLGDGTWVVKISGRTGGFALSRVRRFYNDEV